MFNCLQDRHIDGNLLYLLQNNHYFYNFLSINTLWLLKLSRIKILIFPKKFSSIENAHAHWLNATKSARNPDAPANLTRLKTKCEIIFKFFLFLIIEWYLTELFVLSWKIHQNTSSKTKYSVYNEYWYQFTAKLLCNNNWRQADVSYIACRERVRSLCKPFSNTKGTFWHYVFSLPEDERSIFEACGSFDSTQRRIHLLRYVCINFYNRSSLNIIFWIISSTFSKSWFFLRWTNMQFINSTNFLVNETISN